MFSNFPQVVINTDKNFKTPDSMGTRSPPSRTNVPDHPGSVRHTRRPALGRRWAGAAAERKRGLRITVSNDYRTSNEDGGKRNKKSDINVPFGEASHSSAGRDSYEGQACARKA